MKRFFILCISLISVCGKTFSQGDIDKQEKLFYRNEQSYSFNLTSTGWGVNMRDAKHIDAANKTFREFDFCIIKHPQEIKQSGLILNSLGNFVYGKKNIVFDFRFGFGKQQEIYRKFDIGGVSIRRFYAIGPSLALLKPIYYEIYNQETGYQIVKYYNNIYYNDGFTRASFFRGFNEIQPIPGGFVKLGMSFEYSPDDKILHAIEAGATIEGFLTKLEMMDNYNNKQFLISLFVCYRFGKVYDKKPQKDKIRKREHYFY